MLARAALRALAMQAAEAPPSEPGRSTGLRAVLENLVLRYGALA